MGSRALPMDQVVMTQVRAEDELQHAVAIPWL